MVRPLSALIATLSLAAGVAAGQNPDKPAQEPPADPTALFQKLDGNSDGQLDDQEAGEEHARLFKRLLRKADQDGDGKLSRSEFIAALQEERPQPPADRPGPQGDERRRQFLQANPEELFKRLDANGDGKVELEEVPEQIRQGMQRFFEQADANRDKSLTLEELRKGHDYLRTLAGLNPSPNSPNREAPQADGMLFQALDANRDGSISADELAGAAAALKKLDRDGDGQITRREIMPGPLAGDDPQRRRPGVGAPAQMLERLKRLDRNGDGKLAADELPPFLANRFNQLDANGDGSLDQDELKSAVESIRGPMRRPGDSPLRRPRQENDGKEAEPKS